MSSPESPGIPARGNRYHHGDLRNALIQATLLLIEERGPNGFTLREAARRAGVSQAAPYRHFADKTALLVAVAQQGFETLAERMENAMAAHLGELGDELRSAGRAYVEFALERPARYQIMFGSAVQGESVPKLDEASRRAFKLLVEAIVRGQEAGEVRPGDPVHFALTSWSLSHGLATLLIAGQIEGVDADGVEGLALRHFEILEAGMGVDASATSSTFDSEV